MLIAFAYTSKACYTIFTMSFIWDYDVKKLKKSKQGKLLILERQINYGVYPSDKEKISLKEVKRNWDKLHLEPLRKKLFQLLIWGK